MSLSLTLRIGSSLTRTYLVGVSSKSHYPCAVLPSRYLSGTTVKSAEFPPNSSLDVQYIHNRNPRNLEKLRIAPKPKGWWLDKSGRCYWNKVIFELSGKHVTARLQHFEGYVPVVASTREWCINKFLYSTKDTSAVEAVGRVFAQRCIESGIIEVYCDYKAEDRQKEKVNVFLTALEEAGISLIEPEEIEIREPLNFPRLPDKPWEVLEEMNEPAQTANTISASRKHKP